MAEVEVFKIDIQPVVSELAKLGSELEKARANYQETKKAQGEYSEDAIRAKSEVNVLSKEVNALTNVLTNQQKGLGELDKAAKANIDITKLQGNTIETNRKLYNALYNQQLRNPSPIIEKQLKSLSDTLKDQEKKLGDTRRSVGDYQGGIVAAAKELNVFGVSAGQLKSGLDAAKTGFQAAGGGVKGFSAALATTGIPIVVFAMQELFNVFQSFKPIADAVESSVVGLKAAFGALISGGNIKAAVNQSLELLETMRDLEDTQSGYNIQLERQNSQVEKLIIQSKDRSKTEQEKIKLLNEAETLSKKIYDDEVERNNKLLVSERNNLLQKSGLTKAELKLLAEAADASDVNFQKAKDKFEAQTKIGEDELRKYQETLLARAKLDGQRNKDLEKIVNLTNKNIEKEEAAQEKAQAEREKREAKQQAAREKQLAEEQKYADNLKALSEQFILDDRQRLIKSYDDKKATITGKSQEEIDLRAAIEKQKIAALEKFEQDAEKKRQENQKRIEAEIIANNAKEFNAQIEANKRSLDLELQQVDLSLGTEEEKLAKKRELNLDFLEEQLELTEQYLGADGVITQSEMQGIQKLRNEISLLRKGATTKPQGDATFASAIGIDEEQLKAAAKGLGEAQQAVSAISNAINAGYELRLQEIENAKNAEIQAIEQSGLSAEEKEKKIAEINKKAAKEEYEIQKKQFEVNKAIQIVQTIIAGALGVVSAFQLGPIAGAIAAAAIAVTTGVQVALIAAQKPPPPPKFATGVIGLEGAGTATSDSIDAKLSRGESVMTAKATERFAPILAQMELAVGNRPNFQMGNKKFATGFIPIGDGGYSTRNAASDLMAANASEKAMMQAVAAMPAQKLVLEEFRNFETNVDKSVAISEL
jgi:hypothetical protein